MNTPLMSPTNDGDALLAAIRAHPLERTPQLEYRDWAEENPETVRALIRLATARLELLTAFGVGLGRRVRTETPEARQARFNREQFALFGETEGFAASMAWLATRGKRRTPDHSSYFYKHEVERFWEPTAWPVYVANGAFIAAAICSEFALGPSDPDSPNVNVGVSRRPLRPARTSPK